MSIFSIYKIFKPLRLGKVKELNNQFIETKYIVVFPICSYFVLEKENKQIEIPLNKHSLKAFFIPFTFILSGFAFFVIMLAISSYLHLKSTDTFLDYLPISVSFTLIIIGFYFLYRPEKKDEFEIKKREALQKAINLNSLPEWLSENTRKSILNKMNLEVNWITKVEQGNFTDLEKHFTAMYYTYTLNPSDKNKLLLEKLERKLNVIRL